MSGQLGGGAGGERSSLLVSDGDGTLVTNDKRLSTANVAAGRRLAAAGVRLSLVSSRPPIGFASLRDALDLRAPLGAFNGGTILNPDFSVVDEVLVPAEAARLSVEAFAAFGLDAWLFTRDRWYVLDADGAYVPKERMTIAHEPDVAASFEPYYGAVGKLVGSSRDFDAGAACEGELQRRLGDRAAARRSQAYYLDVTPRDADKGHAVRRIAAALGVPMVEVAVIGDMGNDMPMFDVAPHRIAMGNGIDALKARATFVTRDNEHDGFAAAVEDYVLPRAAGSASQPGTKERSA